MPDTKSTPMFLCSICGSATHLEDRVIVPMPRGDRVHASYVCRTCLPAAKKQALDDLGRTWQAGERQREESLEELTRVLYRLDRRLARFVGSPDSSNVREARARLIYDWIAEGKAHLDDGTEAYARQDESIDF